MNTLKILHIEDESDIVELVRDFMAIEGHEAISTINQDEVYAHIRSGKIDAVLLDYILPQTNGMDILKKIREFSTVPVLIMSGVKTETVDKVVCIQEGADDYIEKPFSPHEVLVRIEAIVRRASQQKDPKEEPHSANYMFDIWRVDKSQYQVFDQNGVSASLTTKEFTLLDKIASSPNVAFERETLLEFMHDDNLDVYDRAIDIYMTRIRKKLNDDPQNPKYIKTVRGIGYMFCAAVEKAT